MKQFHYITSIKNKHHWTYLAKSSNIATESRVYIRSTSRTVQSIWKMSWEREAWTRCEGETRRGRGEESCKGKEAQTCKGVTNGRNKKGSNKLQRSLQVQKRNMSHKCWKKQNKGRETKTIEYQSGAQWLSKLITNTTSSLHLYKKELLLTRNLIFFMRTQKQLPQTNNYLVT